MLLFYYTYRSEVAHGSTVANYLESILIKIYAGEQQKQKDIKRFNEIQRLHKILQPLLHEAILICIDNQTTEFNWDLSIMERRKIQRV